MRLLDRDRRSVRYALWEGMAEEIDAEGRRTGNHVPSYGEPVEALASVSADRGTVESDSFGTDVDYDCTVTFDDPSLPIDDQTVFWIGRESGPWSHKVAAAPARTPNLLKVAVKRREVAE